MFWHSTDNGFGHEKSGNYGGKSSLVDRRVVPDRSKKTAARAQERHLDDGRRREQFTQNSRVGFAGRIGSGGVHEDDFQWGVASGGWRERSASQRGMKCLNG